MTAPARARLPALDGLRAVAVTAVVAFHASGAAPSGFLGVDVFFVLSGFLITGLLVAEVERTERIDLLGFYRRRFVRLFPALALVCLAVAAAALLAGRSTAPTVLSGAAASLLYVANLWLATGHDMPLLEHMWTLALEWQFYLVWPFVVLLVHRVRPLGLLVPLAAVALPVAGSVVTLGPVAGSYARTTGLLVGAVLAVALRRGGRWVAAGTILGVPALVLLVLALALPSAWLGPLRGLLGTAVVVLTVPVIIACTRRSRAGRCLGATPLVWLGERSYGVYLWHFPILSILLNQVGLATPVAVRLVAGVALSLAAAAASYRWVETPLLQTQRRPTNPRVAQD